MGVLSEVAMLVRLFASVLLLAGLATAAAAQPGSAPTTGCNGTVLLEDNFAQVDPAWSLTNPFTTISGGKLRINAKPGFGYGAFYEGALFGNADMCVDVTMPEVREPNTISGGLLFHFQDFDNTLMVLLNAGGYICLQRRQDKQTLFPVTWRKTTALKTGANAINSLRVTWKGTTVALYLNDKPIVTGKAPGLTGKGKIGLVGYSEKSGSNLWQFGNLKITEPPK
jgi:hypothetical protein